MMSLITCHSYSQTLKKGPYLLYHNDSTRMEVLWQTDTTSVDLIRWGTDQDYLTGNAFVAGYGNDHQHSYRINGLEPGARYYYLLTVGRNSYKGSFYTAPPSGQSTLNFFAYGDSRTDVASHDHVAGVINEQWIDDPASQTMIISMGDLVTNGNLENYWSSDMFNPDYPAIRQMLANLPLLACRGNHEGNGSLFNKYFPYPISGNYYYSIDYGPAHFTFVDVYVPFNPGSEQYNWIVNDLSGSASPWKFMCLHTPGWSAAGGHDNNNSVQEYLEPLCEDFNVSVLFAGHNHYYARAIVKTGDGDSVVHITTGGGGAPLHTPKTGQENVLVISKRHHFCKISIMNENLLQFTAISDNNEIIDQFVIDRGTTSISNFQTAGNLLTITPNPFNFESRIEYTIEENALVQLSLYNLDGEEVIQLVPETMQDRGHYKLTLDGSKLPGGIYVCKLMAKTTGGKTDLQSRKVLLVK